MTSKLLTSLAAFGSFSLLAGAYLFQAFGYAPCAMCLWQRWPHAAAIIIGVLAFMIPLRIWAWLGALAALTTGAIGVFHSGVERKWWEGPSSCTGTGGLDGLSAQDLLSTDAPRLVLCDVVSWELFGLSMATWNALFSFALVVIWVAAARSRTE